MNRFKLPDHFSLISLLPWMLLALVIEQGPALSFYPDANFSHQIELVEQRSVEVASSVQLESDQELNQRNSVLSLLASLAIPSSFIPSSIGDKSSSSFVPQQVQRRLLSWIQSRSLPYQLC